MKYFYLLLSFYLFAFSQFTNAVPQQVRDHYWQPMVEFTAEGDRQLAVERLEEIVAVQQFILDNRTWNKEADDFLANLMGSLENFDLTELYQSLPDKSGQAGKVHSLIIQGQRVQGKDAVLEGFSAGIVRASSAQAKQALTQIGDFRLKVAVEPKSSKFGEGFLVRSSIAGVVGAASWSAVIKAVRKEIKIFQPYRYLPIDLSSDWTVPYKLKLDRHSAKYGEEDLQLLIPGQAVFPASQGLFNQVAKITNILVNRPSHNASLAADLGYEKIRATVALEPERMEKLYPDLADYFSGLSSILNMTLELQDEHGTFLTLYLNSHEMTATLEGLMLGECLLPTVEREQQEQKGQQGQKTEVLVNHPVCFGEDKFFTVVSGLSSNLLGINAQVSDIRTYVSYRNQPNGAEILTSTTELPKVKIAGAALGIVPIFVLDLFLPGNVDQLISEFMSVVLHGNDGKGVATETTISSSRDHPYLYVATDVAVELRNSFLVRLGASAVNDRLVPDEDARKDIRQFIRDIQTTFLQDVLLYKQSLGKRTLAKESLASE